VKALYVFVAAALTSFSHPLIAQTPTKPAWPEACGEIRARVPVDLDATQHTALPPETGSARIFFIFDYGSAPAWSYPFLRVGIDGQWAGGLAKNSWFATSVEPGERHLCVAAKEYVVGLSHLKVEAGKTYYYQIRALTNGAFLFYIGPDLVDSDEANYLIESYPQTTPHPKK